MTFIPVRFVVEYISIIWYTYLQRAECESMCVYMYI